MATMFGLMRLGRDAEIRRTPGGQAVANLSLVYNHGRKDEESGERPSQWIDAALWGDRAEALAEYLTKGSLHLFTLDDVHIEKYTDRDGYEASKLAARVANVELGPKKEGAGNGAASGSTGQRRPAGNAPAPAAGRAPAPAPAAAGGVEDDEIPF